MSRSSEAAPRPREAAGRLAVPSAGLPIAERLLGPRRAGPARIAGTSRVDRGQLVLLAADAAQWSAAMAVLTLVMLYVPEPSPVLLDLPPVPEVPAAPTAGVVWAPDGQAVPVHAAASYLRSVVNSVWADAMRRQLRQDVRTRYAHAALQAGNPHPLLRQQRAETPYATAGSGRGMQL